MLVFQADREERQRAGDRGRAPLMSAPPRCVCSYTPSPQIRVWLARLLCAPFTPESHRVQISSRKVTGRRCWHGEDVQLALLHSAAKPIAHQAWRDTFMRHIAKQLSGRRLW